VPASLHLARRRKVSLAMRRKVSLALRLVRLTLSLRSPSPLFLSCVGILPGSDYNPWEREEELLRSQRTTTPAPDDIPTAHSDHSEDSASLSASGDEEEIQSGDEEERESGVETGKTHDSIPLLSLSPSHALVSCQTLIQTTGITLPMRKVSLAMRKVSLPMSKVSLPMRVILRSTDLLLFDLACLCSLLSALCSLLSALQ
jgi:hypothetical protein